MNPAPLFYSIRYLSAVLLIALALLLPARTLAQGTAKDTLNYSSTCVGTTILFGSPIFDSLPFPSSIKWKFGDPASGFYDSSTAQKARHAFATPGTYNVSLTVVNNNTDTIKILKTLNIVTPMAYNFGPDVFLCEGQATTLTAPAAPGALYTWNDDSTAHTDILHVEKSGVYTVSIDGCGVADSIGVYISQTPEINLGKDHVMCDSANLLLNAATQNGEYAWLLDGNTLPDTDDQLLTHYPGGTYVAVVTVPGCGVYGDTVRITYAAPLAPSFSLGPDTLLCPKEIFTLNARLSGASAWDWSTGGTDSLIRITNTGTYWVFVTCNGGCQVTDTVLAKYRGDRPLDFHDTAICMGSTLNLNADFGTGTYNWSSVPPQRDDQNQTGQSTYFVYKAGTYAVSAAVGHCIYKDTLVVRFDDSLKVKMITDTTLCNMEEFLLQVPGNADTLIWQDSSFSSAYRVTQPGIYTVIAANGCGRDTLKAVIDMVPCTCQLNMPNAFTPDGDGHNDTFRPLHVCEISEFQMAIYDRYGELVFRSSDTDRGWDGRFHGRPVSPGTFVWMVHYVNTMTKQPVLRKGTVLVLR